MDVTQEMYTKLFNAITDATKCLERAVEILKQAQVETEEIYINAEE